MASMKGREWTFDTVTDEYDQIRPGYVDELYQALFSYKGIDQFSHVIEIGIGSGQATLPVIQRGCKLTAVEYGEHFSELCRTKFQKYDNFTVLTGKFEDIKLEPEDFDLIYSATAFHWIPEELGYAKVYALLKTGGVFARFSNHPHPDRERRELIRQIDSLYDKYYYPYHKTIHKEPKKLSDEEEAIRLVETAKKYGLKDTCYKLFYRKRDLTAKDYIRLIGTYSDHISIEEGIREEFFGKIEDAINRNGGIITMYDTIDLELARKL